MKLLGKKIETLRKAAGLGQEALAGTAINTKTVGRIESGDANPKIGTLQSIAEALGKTLIIDFGNSEEQELLRLFNLANERNQGLIIGYAQGLLNDHQPDPGSGRIKGPKKLL